MVARESLRAMSKLKASLMSRLRGMITRSRVASSSVTGQGQSLTLDMYEGEQRDSVEYFESYGISGAVPTGSTCLAFAAGGSRDQVIALGASPKGSIPAGKLAGEVDYWSVHGQRIRHHASGDTSIQPGPTGIVYLGSGVNPALPNVAASGDSITINVNLISWMEAVAALLNVPPGTFEVPTPLTIGTITPTPTRNAKVP